MEVESLFLARCPRRGTSGVRATGERLHGRRPCHHSRWPARTRIVVSPGGASARAGVARTFGVAAVAVARPTEPQSPLAKQRPSRAWHLTGERQACSRRPGRTWAQRWPSRDVSRLSPRFCSTVSSGKLRCFQEKIRYLQPAPGKIPMKNTPLVPVQTAPKLHSCHSTLFIPTFLCISTHAPKKKERKGGGIESERVRATQEMENQWRWSSLSSGDGDRHTARRFFEWAPCRNGGRVRSGPVVQAPEPQLSGTAEHQQSATKLICARSASLRRLRRGHGRHITVLKWPDYSRQVGCRVRLTQGLHVVSVRDSQKRCDFLRACTAPRRNAAS